MFLLDFLQLSFGLLVFKVSLENVFDFYVYKAEEEKQREEEEKRASGKRAEVERLEVQKEVAVFNQKLMRVKEAFQRAGSSIVNMLRLADTNNDGTISLQEFMTTLQR